MSTRLEDDPETVALLHRLARLNPGLLDTPVEEVIAVLQAYRQDLLDGKDPKPPYKGLLPQEQ